MKLTYYKRALYWIYQLIITLIIFWLNNPKETGPVLRFIAKKTLALPKFLSRNVLVEHHSQLYKRRLVKISRLYDNYSNDFNPSSAISYKQLARILSAKSEILYFLVRKLKPDIVVETGVAAGESTGFILQAIKDNQKGQLYSIDLPFQWYIYGQGELHLDSLPAGKTPGYLVPEDLKDNWQLIIGKSSNKLSKLLERLGQIDIFFHDSEHTEKTMMFEYQVSWPYIKKGGFLISDDVDYTQAFNKFYKKMKVKMFRFKDLGVIKKSNG